MSEAQAAPKLRKWPFYLADVILSAIAAFVLYRLGVIDGTTEVVISVACLVAAGVGAWLSVTPWLVEYRVHAATAENKNLKSTLDQIQDLQKVAELIRQANSQWQSVQDASGRTVNAAREISEKMKVETDEFMKFIANAHDQERAGLRLEVEKHRKMEGDWIKVSVQMLDHVFAIVRAAERSGQQNLIAQLSQFQNACREVARRMGLAPFVPSIGEKFDSRGHQLTDPEHVPAENATIADVLATGFTYQGHLLRRALVLLAGGGPGLPAQDQPTPTKQETVGFEAGGESAPATNELVESPEPEQSHEQASAEEAPSAAVQSAPGEEAPGAEVQSAPVEEIPMLAGMDAAQTEEGEAVKRQKRQKKDSAQNELPLV